MSEELWRYPMLTFWSEDDKEFVTVAIDLPGHSAVMPNRQQSIHEAEDAMVAWVDACKSMGRPLPPPSDGEELLAKLRSTSG